MRATSYQLLIHVENDLVLDVGQLGHCRFPAGYYIYTGSARSNMQARLLRHLRRDKHLHWHIDYLLGSQASTIIDTHMADCDECRLNQQTPGQVLVEQFGASDCQAGCGSHLRYSDRLPSLDWSGNN